MNHWWGRWVLIGAVAVGGSALAQEGTPGDPHQPPPREQRAYPRLQDEMNQLLVANTERGFLEQLHTLNQTEMTLGELTQRKASTKTVQDFGEHLVRDHRAADQRLMELAKQKGYRLGRAEPNNDLQRRLDAAQMATKSKLAVLQGPLFDQQLLASQVADHDQSIALVMAGRQRYPELAPMLDALLPSLQQHREQAYRLLGQMAPQPRQARPPAGERR